MIAKLIQDRKNKEFKLYITIEQLKETLRAGYFYKNHNHYKAIIDYACDNLHSESDIKKYLEENYFNHEYTYEEIDAMEHEERLKTLQEDAAYRELYDAQYTYYCEGYSVELKCIKCENIQETYPLSDRKTNPCKKCGCCIFVDIDTKLDENGYIICCDEVSKLSMCTDSFKNCYATHGYSCSKCNREDKVYLFREEER